MSKGQARDHAAALVGASPRYVSDAKRLAEEALDLLEKVRVESLTIPQAKHEVNTHKRQKVRVHPHRQGKRSGAHS